MLTAVKANREEKITEDKKEEYLRAGYDVIDEKGNRTAAPSKTVPYAEVEKLKEENKKLKAENKKLKDAGDDKLAEGNKKLADELEALKKELEEAKAGK